MEATRLQADAPGGLLLSWMELIHCTQGKGCFVGPKPKTDAGMPELSSSWQLSIIDYLPRAHPWRHFQGAASNCRYRLHVAEVDAQLLPNREIRKNIFQLVAEDPTIIGKYGPFQGDAELRRALSDYFRERGIAANEPEHHRFRISYSYMDEKSLREAVILLCDVLRKYLANPLPKETHPWSTI